MDNRTLDRWIEAMLRRKYDTKRVQPSYGRTGSTLTTRRKPASSDKLSKAFPSANRSQSAANSSVTHNSDNLFIPFVSLDVSQVQDRRPRTKWDDATARMEKLKRTIAWNRLKERTRKRKVGR